MKKYIFILVSLFLLNDFAIGQNPNQEKTNTDAFLTSAVLTGLKKDKFPQDIVNQILENESAWFVMKCPICTPVSRALKKYSYETKSEAKTKLPKSLVKRFKSADKTKKQLALRDLIDKYVQAHYQVLQFTAEEKTNMEKELLADRKRGMELKSDAFGKFCPSCDGANGKSKE